MLRIATLLLLAPAVLGQDNSISTASDYARVREILKEYYSRASRAYGHDYDPTAIQSDQSRQKCEESNEVCANKKYWGDLFENDIVLTLPQAENLLDESAGRRGKRQAQPTVDSFWRTLTVPYVFGFQDSEWQTLIRRALRHIETETCVRFSENGLGADRLMYIRGSGCWSNVGRIGGTQQVSIGYGCDAMGIIAHETLHALGLWHEQSRTDRDNHIFITPSAIIRGTEGNFQKRTPQTSDNMGQPYDLGSVMHYSPKSFTNDYNTPTISTRDPRYQHTIGQRESISFKDAKMINLRYCDRICPRKLNCANGAYTDPNNCNQCKCPAGYGGTYCDQVQRTSCGGELVASPSQQTLNSGPVYAGTHCVWRIRSPAGQRLEVDVRSVNFVCRETCTSYVEVKYKADKETAGARLCCEQQKTVILAENDEVLVIFKGDADLQPGYLGFEMKYRYCKCGKSIL
ncbi:hypothetical protein PFISCL1PPCAC_22837 [Pristionchus fissidentatus]|uniref:Zinc metalloproteinase n=1 Tax=Pristionchus fissidentatus TaxID=1538716 RepID=A0AAV5WLS9_9BILA|nr:hypothetical protein PFISCL1PPCAC_22837 [Pristionchus fissidentatus]